MSTDESPATLLQVPHAAFSTQRSRSVESGSIDSSMASYLEVPKRFQRRRSSNTKSPVPCVHCLYIEERERWLESGGAEAASAATANARDRYGPSQTDEHHQLSETSISDDDDIDDDDDDDDTDESDNIDKHHLNIPLLIPHCNIKFSLSPTTDAFPLQSAHDAAAAHDSDEQLPSTPPHSPSSSTNETQCDKTSPTPTIDIELPAQLANRGRRRSISRQEAIFIEPTGNSLENLDSMKSPTDETVDAMQRVIQQQQQHQRRHNEKLSTSDSSDYVQDYYLTVPETDLRRDRAASVDSSFSKLSSNGKTEELQPEIDGFLTVPTSAVRSRSVDIVLPTNEQARYKALAMAGPSMSKRYVIHITSHHTTNHSFIHSFIYTK